MEEVKNTINQSSLVLGKSKLRYPLRSASKIKDQPNIISNEFDAKSESSKRERPSSVAKSVSVLELSGKDKAAVKPPRRVSIPAKLSTVTPNVTPISDYRTRKSANGSENCDTPMSDVSRSSARKRFNVLTSASYWLSQIKLSESAGKHSISLGFFKLALEAGCETLQRLRDELRLYAGKHNLAEFDDIARSLFESYEISESLKQLQISETCSHVHDDVQSTSSTFGTRKLKPKTLNTDTQTPSENVSTHSHKTRATSKIRTSVNRNPANSVKAKDGGDGNIKKRVQKADGHEIKHNENSASAEGDAEDNQERLEENKENLDAPLTGEISVTDGN